MKNVMMNVKTTFKKAVEKANEKPVLKLVRNIAVTGIMLVPRIAFAAGDPTAAISAGVNTVTLSILGLAAGFGGLAIVIQGLQYHWAGEAHDKAQCIKNMKGTALIAALIGIGPMAIGWISSLFHG